MTHIKRISLGQWGEKIACNYLIKQGYSILGTNIQTPYGEIDLLAKQADTLVFVEVKTRQSSSLGLPELSITPKKFTHMIHSAQSYLLDHPDLTFDWRIDVIAIRLTSAGQSPEIIHFENVNDVR